MIIIAGVLGLLAFTFFSSPTFSCLRTLAHAALHEQTPVFRNLLDWCCSTDSNGYCYLKCFVGYEYAAVALLGKFPHVDHVRAMHTHLFGLTLSGVVRLVPQGESYHCEEVFEGSQRSESVDWYLVEGEPTYPLVGGSVEQVERTATAAAGAGVRTFQDLETMARLISKQLPVANDMKGTVSRYTNALSNEFAHLKPSFSIPYPHAYRKVNGDDEQKFSHALTRKMNKVSAMEAAKVLLSGMESLGSTEERLDIALDTFAEGVATAVPPSNPNYARLSSMIGPLRYSPRIEGHAEAATVRRAAMNHAVTTLQGAIVGLVSPSNAELHAFPMAAVWQYEDALDITRHRKHCSMCKLPQCSFLLEAKRAGRYYKGNNQARASEMFKRFEVSSLLLINIEPNLEARSLLKLMVTSGAYHALSLVTVDWRVVLGRAQVDTLTGMTTELSYGKVVSSFADGGDYVQSLSAVKQLFAPTYASGHAMRRTIVFGEGASQYYDISLVRGGWATRCVPEHGKYYFIRLILPDLSRPVVLVERKGFDRLLATYRTQAIKNKDTARICLRQSVVTYSISGTQVTPRLALSATEAEALGVWIEVYSLVQDTIAERQHERLKPGTAVTEFKTAVWSAVTDGLKRTTVGAMALGSASTVDALIRVYRDSVDDMTLDQMSQAALEEHFGTKVEPLSLQNMVVSTWGSLFEWVRSPGQWFKTIERVYKDSWCITFSYLDLVSVSLLLTGTFSIQLIRVVLDCVMTACRIMGRMDALHSVTRFVDMLDWQAAKANKAWVGVQDAQHMDFQAATIDIVETFYNTFGTDHAASIQKVRERQMVPEAQVKELELNAALPYSDFLSEVKLFLGKFNSHVRRCSMAATLLSAFHHDTRSAPPGQKEKMIHLLKKEMEDVPTEKPLAKLGFALTGQYSSEPVPIRPINNTDVREAFKLGQLVMTSADGPVTLHKLHQIDGVYDFSPIHKLMDLQHGDTVNSENIRGPNYLSPDARGAKVQEQLIAAVYDRRLGARFVPPAAMLPWYTRQLAAEDQLDFVADILRRQEKLFSGEQTANWLAHITGLAMGGKSKGLRSWLTCNDLVVVPTRQLKEEWQENLGKMDPVRRAAVVTQHEALDVKYASRYVFVDECYAFDPEHLQAIANRHKRSRGVITIGDRRQIANVFTPTGIKLTLAECPCVMITPTTFVGWDAAAVYLNTTTTDTYVEHLYCGGTSAETIRYTLSADDTLLPGDGDKAIQGTQIGKELVAARGAGCVTVHEAQGSRTEHTVVHGLGKGLIGDLRWLGLPEQASHCGVLITRARQETVFVVESLSTLSSFRWFDNQTVNGPLPTQLIYGGTSWDLVEPRTESESEWVHLNQPAIVESHLEEQPLTDPITIATVFDQDGEPLSTSEIRTNVELVSGVSFQDVGIPNSDAFDNYTFQPRDVPGADQVQALTRAVADVKTRPQDFADAEKIVEMIFDEVLDKKLFFAHVANSRRAALLRQTRQQVIDGCYANTESMASTLSFAFLKPEFAKKPSVLQDGPSELKAQGVVSASDMQQALFADVCDSLTHAWARAMRPGKLSPVGFREEEVEDFLATFDSSYELDIEKQDSSHKPVHILVAGIFIELASDKLGLSQVAREIREERTVRMMNHPFKFVLSKALASGDPWTLIINKIMAVSSLISVAELRDVRMCQSGDDVTLDREPRWRSTSLRDQLMANKGLTWKMEERDQRRDGVTFISRAVLPHRTVVYKALRTILKYMVRPRNSIQHAGITADALRIQKLAARHGLQAYAEARCQVWGGDPVVVFDMWTRALAVARTPYAALPEELKKSEPRQYTIRERDGGCFGYALAQCVDSNVAAINAIAAYSGPVTITTAMNACRDNKVRFIIMNERWANRSRARLQTEMDRKKFSRAFVVIYEDHAVAVVPNTITLHSGFGKRTITWKSSMSKDVLITDFE